MLSVTESLLVLLVLTNLLLLGSGRLGTCIRLIAGQGVLLGLLPLLRTNGPMTLRLTGIALVGLILKSLVFPWLLFRAVQVVKIKREVEPLVGHGISLLLGTVVFAFSLWLSNRLPLPNPEFSSLVVPVAFFTIFTGCLLLTIRSKAVFQVLSYLILENGIYLFGATFVEEAPLLVEIGILLDVTVGIFIMGIMMQHISQEFDSINVKNLSELKDSGT